MVSSTSPLFYTKRLVLRNHVHSFSTTTNDKGFEILLRARPPHIRQIPSGNRWIQAKVCDEFSHCLEPQDPATTRFEMWLRYRKLQPRIRRRSVIIEIRTLACRFFLCSAHPYKQLLCVSNSVCVTAAGPSAQRLSPGCSVLHDISVIQYSSQRSCDGVQHSFMATVPAYYSRMQYH